MFFSDIYQAEPAEFAKSEADLALQSLTKKTRGEMRNVMSQKDKMVSESGFATNRSLDNLFDTAQADMVDSYSMGSQGISQGLEKSLFDIKSSQDRLYYDRLMQADEVGLI